MKPKINIYHFEAQYLKAKIRLNESNLSERNKELITQFETTCALEGLGTPRKIKIISVLMMFASKYLSVDFDKAIKDDLRKGVLTLDTRDDIAYWTKHDYHAVLKKFYKWLIYGDDYKTKAGYPEIINWLTVGINSRDKPRVQASDILTEREIDLLIQSAEHPRDKAFISMLYELGARISEIGNLRIKDLTQDRYSYIIDLSGKTGHRTPRIVMSSSCLAYWLNNHPLRNDPNAPLWVMIGEKHNNAKMNYATFRALILRLKKRAKISKRIYAHLFRHTRVTHLLGNKQINEAQAKVYFGWVPSSNMLSEYSHLVSQDVNEVMLEIHGIKPAQKEEEPRARQCPKCKTINPSDYLFCGRCGGILDVRTAIELDGNRKESDALMTRLLEDNDVKELLVRKIIDGGLGKELMSIFLTKN